MQIHGGFLWCMDLHPKLPLWRDTQYSGFLYNRGDCINVVMTSTRQLNVISTSIRHQILMEKCQKINRGDHDYTGNQSTCVLYLSMSYQ